MYIAAAAPTEPEKAYRHKEAANHCWLKTNLGFDLAVGIELLLLVEVEVREKTDHGDKSTNQDAQKSETFLSEIESV
jgi:hypothetical protein